MKLNIGNHPASVIERGVYYLTLSGYPQISLTELKIAIAFIKYEKLYNRQTEIVCDDENIKEKIKTALDNPDTIEPFVLSETTKFVYHATELGSAKKILSSGKLLSAVNVYGKSGEILSSERKDTPWDDPADFFEYIMFCNGDDATGDYVVLSENFPAEEDLAKGNFNAGVRFYIRSVDIVKHPGNIFDGYHPTKVKDEIVLSDYLFACIVPEQYEKELLPFVPQQFENKVHFLPQKGLSIIDWTKRAYDYIERLEKI